MKRIFSFLMATVIVLGSMCTVSAEAIMLSDFEITADGEITAYFGDESVVVPEKVDGIPVTKIGDKTFFDIGIADVYLPEGLKEIGKSAFEGSNITSVDIPSTVSYIGDRAFANCVGLITVFAKIDENTVIGEDAFSGVGHVIFFIDCDVDTRTIERKLLQAKGNERDFEVEIRHVSPRNDDEGFIVCDACGYSEVYEYDTLPFTDVSQDSWYYDYVKTAYDNRIINGKSETIFDPDATMTCAEAIKIAACINELFFEPIPEYVSGPWYQPYVDYAYDQGIIAYYMDFDWEKPITRAEMAYIFSHCDPHDDWFTNINDVPLNDIPDVNDLTPFVYEIIKLYNKGIVVGDENMNFYPNDNIKRCEAAAIVSRIMDWNSRIELPKG